MKVSLEKPWLKYYDKIPKDMKPPVYGSAYLAIKEHSFDKPDRVALDYYGKKTTYEEMFRKVDRIAAALTAIGVTKGDIVTLMVLNDPNAICTFYALNKIGAVANLISGQKLDETIIKSINLTETKYIFALDFFINKIEAIKDKIPNIQKIIISNVTDNMPFFKQKAARMVKKLSPKTLPNTKQYIHFTDFVKLGNSLDTPTPVNEPDTLAALIYTSGTTGGEKGIMLSNRNINSFAMFSDIGRNTFWHDGRFLLQVPLFVVSGLMAPMHFTLYTKNTVLIRIPMQDDINKLLDLKPNYIVSYPEEFRHLDTSIKRDLSCILEMYSGSDVLSLGMEQSINDYLEKCHSSSKICNAYGMTEASAGLSMNMNVAYKAGSTGVPLWNNVIAAFDPDTGEECDANVPGELCMCSDMVMMGYFKMKEETDRVLKKHADGKIWLHTGDLGYVDEDGFVFITGRLVRGMAVRIGTTYERIFCSEVEKVIREHPAVSECFVVPKEDDVKSDIPAAFIILKSGYSKECLDNIRQYANSNLDDFRKPGRYYFVDSFPLTSAKKINFAKLEDIANASK